MSPTNASCMAEIFVENLELFSHEFQESEKFYKFLLRCLATEQEKFYYHIRNYYFYSVQPVPELIQILLDRYRCIEPNDLMDAFEQALLKPEREFNQWIQDYEDYMLQFPSVPEFQFCLPALNMDCSIQFERLPFLIDLYNMVSHKKTKEDVLNFLKHLASNLMSDSTIVPHLLFAVTLILEKEPTSKWLLLRVHKNIQPSEHVIDFFKTKRELFLKEYAINLEKFVDFCLPYIKDRLDEESLRWFLTLSPKAAVKIFLEIKDKTNDNSYASYPIEQFLVIDSKTFIETFPVEKLATNLAILSHFLDIASMAYIEYPKIHTSLENYVYRLFGIYFREIFETFTLSITRPINLNRTKDMLYSTRSNLTIFPQIYCRLILTMSTVQRCKFIDTFDSLSDLFITFPNASCRDFLDLILPKFDADIESIQSILTIWNMDLEQKICFVQNFLKLFSENPNYKINTTISGFLNNRLREQKALNNIIVEETLNYKDVDHYLLKGVQNRQANVLSIWEMFVIQIVDKNELSKLEKIKHYAITTKGIAAENILDPHRLTIALLLKLNDEGKIKTYLSKIFKYPPLFKEIIPKISLALIFLINHHLLHRPKDISNENLFNAFYLLIKHNSKDDLLMLFYKYHSALIFLRRFAITNFSVDVYVKTYSLFHEKLKYDIQFLTFDYYADVIDLAPDIFNLEVVTKHPPTSLNFVILKSFTQISECEDDDINQKHVSVLVELAQHVLVSSSSCFKKLFLLAASKVVPVLNNEKLTDTLIELAKNTDSLCELGKSLLAQILIRCGPQKIKNSIPEQKDTALDVGDLVMSKSFGETLITKLNDILFAENTNHLEFEATNDYLICSKNLKDLYSEYFPNFSCSEKVENMSLYIQDQKCLTDFSIIKDKRIEYEDVSGEHDNRRMIVTLLVNFCIELNESLTNAENKKSLSFLYKFLLRIQQVFRYNWKTLYKINILVSQRPFA